jgi:hypothetical protein
MTEAEEIAKLKGLLERIYNGREPNPEEMALDGIPGHFFTDLMMQEVAHAIGHTDYVAKEGW